MRFILSSIIIIGLWQFQLDNYCGLPPQLRPNAEAQVIDELANNLRAEPTPDSQLLGTIPSQEVIMILEGDPVCNQGYTYWQVNYKGQIGWTAESDQNEYFLALYTHSQGEPPQIYPAITAENVAQLQANGDNLRLQDLPDQPTHIWSLAYDPLNDALLISTNEFFYVFSPPNNDQPIIQVPSQGWREIMLHPDGNHFLSSRLVKEVLWLSLNYDSGQITELNTFPTSPPTNCFSNYMSSCLSPDGHFAVLNDIYYMEGNSQLSFRLDYFDLEANSVVGSIHYENAQKLVVDWDFSDDSRRFVEVTQDGKITVYNAHSLIPLLRTTTGLPYPLVIRYSPNGSEIALLSTDFWDSDTSTMQFFDASDLTLLWQVEIPLALTWVFQYSWDGSFFFAQTINQTGGATYHAIDSITGDVLWSYGPSSTETFYLASNNLVYLYTSAENAYWRTFSIPE